ncbi:MAG: carnitinyl-CoA dehydratase [Gammaproteobacteria bacterium]|nr:carnitinyl-CoA dehydratase [Gammaproteobacteria bacterium]MDH5312086.1 carnitinyl-CoA dehydratase [Gammaproteobacteria bacterium]
MSNDAIKTRVEGRVLEVTIDRPKANAIDFATSRIMGEVFAGFRDDPELRVAILTAGGERFFSAGWDLKAAAAGEPVDGDYGIGGFGGIQELENFNKPVVCAVNGICCGGGLEIALCADIIIAAEHATFALPEIRSGTVADAASIKLPKRIPYHVAMEMLLTGRWLDAQEAQRWGFVNEVVPAERLLGRAWEVARLIESGPPLVYAAIKEVVREAENMKFLDALRKITKREFPTVDRLYSSEDQLEGARAFAEKRDPVWKGK